MKFYLPLLITILFYYNLLGQRIDIKLTVDGKVRDCILVKPSKSPPVGGYPMVVMLHSSKHDGEEPYNISGWKELGEAENFITVFPSSLKWCINEDGVDGYFSRWVNGNVTEFPCAGPPQDYVDDVKFLKFLVSKINDTLPINLKKVYASGFSNGSAMIHKLAMDAGDVFAAVAGSGGALAMSDSVTNPLQRIPIWFMVGSEDPYFLYQTYTEIPFGEDSVLTYLNKIISRVLTCQGLTKGFTKNETPLSHTYIFNQAQSGHTSRPYLFTLIKGMKHMYANGTNFPIETARLFWEFFKQVTPVATDHQTLNEISLIAFPNPSNDKIQFRLNDVQSPLAYHIRVINSLGMHVYEQAGMKEHTFILDKNKFGIGLFLLEIQIGKMVIHKKFIFN